ncbi:MAG: TCP-1/cpn60 chaperonin family protein [Hymenobacter sp.]
MKAPGFGDRRKAMLEDIATLTGGHGDLGRARLSSSKTLRSDYLGTAEKIIDRQGQHHDRQRQGREGGHQGRIDQIKAQIEKPRPRTTTRRSCRSAWPSSSGGVAILYVGASTEVEMKEKKDRVDDALHATRAAVEEGIVPGGGVALVRAIEALDAVDTLQRRRAHAASTSSARPSKRRCVPIAQNAGGEGSVVVQKVRDGKGDYGYNAREDRYENLHGRWHHRPDQSDPLGARRTRLRLPACC